MSEETMLYGYCSGYEPADFRDAREAWERRRAGKPGTAGSEETTSQEWRVGDQVEVGDVDRGTVVAILGSCIEVFACGTSRLYSQCSSKLRRIEEPQRPTLRERHVLALERIAAVMEGSASDDALLQCVRVFERRQVLQERMAAAMGELDAAGRELDGLQDGCVHQPELRFGGLCMACVRAREVLP